MSKIWRLQRIRDELLLDLINHPNITIDELVNRYNTSKTKLYEYFREEYDTTLGGGVRRIGGVYIGRLGSIAVRLWCQCAVTSKTSGSPTSATSTVCFTSKTHP